MKQVAIVGSGTGGTFAANLLSAKLRDQIRKEEVRILLIGEGFRHHFQPANLDIAFRGSGADSHSRFELDLLKPGITYVPDAAVKIDLENRRITTDSGLDYDYNSNDYEYDYLIIATGAEASPEMIPGLREGSVNFHTGPMNAKKVWDAVRNFKKGKIAVAIGGVPHKCPPSPDEALFLLDEYFRRRGIRDDVELTLLTPYPKPYPADKIAKVVSRLFEEKGIKTIPFFNMESVDPKTKKVYSLEGDEYAYDLLVAVPPHRGTKVVRESGFGDEEGWIPTDRRNMRIKGHDDAFAIGDSTNIPVSKSGVVAHLQSKAVATTIAAEISGKAIECEYNGRINCPMEVGGRRAIFVSATYETPPSDQTPSTVKFAMKRAFGSMYWSALSGRWEWVMDAYFGKTSDEAVRSAGPASPTTDYQTRK
ncbi:MAG: NAD(P)/FAD-dependent oxidoreductase [Thaumarchaeota archaeon]|nr:NAD(P)/FAD-dependent oxidoreductase [Nitrososphaerota archaeon]